MLILPGS